MSTTDKAILSSLAVGMALGLYFGMFISEINMQLACQMDHAVEVKGLFWKPGIKYRCEDISGPAHASSDNDNEKG